MKEGKGEKGPLPPRHLPFVPGVSPTSEEKAAGRVAESLGEGFALLDAAGRLVLVNRRFCHLTGLEEGRLSTETLLIALFPDARERQAARRRLRSLIEEGGRYRFQVMLPAGSGAEAVQVSIARHRQPSGGPTRLAVSLDPVSSPSADGRGDRYEGEWEQAVGEEAFFGETEGEIYQEYLDASPDLHLRLDSRGRIEEINPAVVRLTGYRAEEVAGRPCWAFLTRSSLPRLRAALETLNLRGRIDALELQILCRHGRKLELCANVVTVPRLAGEGMPRGVRVIARDISRRNLLTRQLRRTDRLAATGRLAAGVAHEINNPLQAILMHLAVVEESLPEGFAQQESWERVKEGVRRVRQIVADLLDLHRGQELEPGPVDVRRVVGEVLGLCRAQLRQIGIDVVSELDAGTPRVAATPRHLYQVVLNLVLNAMGAMDEGGVLGIRTRPVGGGEEVEIVISDNGPGIPAEVLPQVFDPFRSAEDRGGTGLGLFVTYGLVREYGGRIRVDSIPGRGTRFRVYLPAAGEREEAEGGSQEERRS